jgi:3D (Asp-Asp-Asp) domain-containing protein
MKRTLSIVLTLAWIGGLCMLGLPGSAGAKTAEIAPVASSVLSMRITAYASVPDETDDTPFITANGTFVHDGVVASNILPFETRIQIPELFGNKVFIVEDRMSQRIKNTIDIWMPSVAKAKYFGVTHTSVVVMDSSSSSVITADAKAQTSVTL